jgi:predicted PhzF superfamily epimerase YddE/YHI9
MHHLKPMELWTQQEVAAWLFCVGLGDKAATFQTNDVDGSALLTLAAPELTDGLDCNHLEAKQLLDALAFTKSVSDLETLAAELHAVKLAAKELEDQLVTKDERIAELEEQIVKEEAVVSDEQTPEGHPEDKILSLEHRHQAERRRLEARQEQELAAEEEVLVATRQTVVQHVRATAPPEGVSEERVTGRRHFKQEYDSAGLW